LVEPGAHNPGERWSSSVPSFTRRFEPCPPCMSPFEFITYEFWAQEDIVAAIELERMSKQSTVTSTNGHPTPGRLLGEERAMTFYSLVPAHRGFSKREEIAKSMMAAILSAEPDLDADFVANEAVEYADALLERLAR
jgi:hypothetical protein